MQLVIYLYLNFISIGIFYRSEIHAENLSGLFSKKEKGYRLKNSVFQSIAIENQMTCAHYCTINNSKCKSFNFNEDPRVKINCELNSKVIAAENDVNLVASTGVMYFEKINEYEGLPSTCSVLKWREQEKGSGYYPVQPNKNEAPFTVFCNMTDKGRIGVTVFAHDSEEKTHVNGYESPGSYSKVVTYNSVTMKQIEGVVNTSTRCEQFTKYNCKGCGFSFGWSPLPESFWVSRQGDIMRYWGGATPGSQSCACGMTGSCFKASRKCNCDANDFIWREDSGFLVDKEYLPVRELRFGDTGYSAEEGYHTLGKLLCWG